MKRALCMILALLSCLGVAVTLVGCEDEHTFSETWNMDETHHWHVCTKQGCEETSDKAEHGWDDGVQMLAPTASTPGVIRYTCKVCAKTRLENVTGDPMVTEAEWINAFSLPDENYWMTIASAERNLAVKKRNGVIVLSNPRAVNLSEKYYVQEGGVYYRYTVSGETVTKQQIAAQDVLRATTLTDLSALAYASFTYNEQGKTYDVAKVVTDNIVYENVSIAFVEKKITRVSFTKKEAGKENENIVIAVTYGTVTSDFVLPQVTE